MTYPEFRDKIQDTIYMGLSNYKILLQGTLLTRGEIIFFSCTNQDIIDMTILPKVAELSQNEIQPSLTKAITFTLFPNPKDE